MILRIKSWQVGGEFSLRINIFLTQPIGTDSVSSQNCIRWWTIRTFGETAAVPSFFFSFFLPSWNKGEGCHFLFGILKGFGIPIFRSLCISFLIFFISEARTNTCSTQQEAGRNIWKVLTCNITNDWFKRRGFKKKLLTMTLSHNIYCHTDINSPIKKHFPSQKSPTHIHRIRICFPPFINKMTCCITWLLCKCPVWGKSCLHFNVKWKRLKNVFLVSFKKQFKHVTLTQSAWHLLFSCNETPEASPAQFF